MAVRHNANNNCGTRDCSVVNSDLWTSKGIKTVLSTLPIHLILDKYWCNYIFSPGYTTQWLIICNYLNTSAQLVLGSAITALTYKSDCRNYHKQDDKDDRMQLCFHNCYVNCYLKFLNCRIEFPHPYSPRGWVLLYTDMMYLMRHNVLAILQT